MEKFLKNCNTFYDSISRYLVGALILAIPLYPKFPFITIPGTYVSIRLEDFLIALLALTWLFGNLVHFPRLFKSDTVRALVLFWVIGGISLISALLITQTVSPSIAFLHWARRIEYMICFLIGMSSVKKPGAIAFYIKCIVVVVVYATIYGVGQKYFNWPIVTTQNEEYSKGVALRFIEGGHIVSTFAGHYDMASVLILLLPLIATVAVAKKTILRQVSSVSPLITRSILSVTFLMGVWLLASAASRISIVSYLGAMVLSLLFVRKYLFIPVILVVSILLTGLSGSLVSRYMNIYDVTIKKLLSVEIVPAVQAAESAPATEDRSTNIRLHVEWPRAIRAVQKNPFLGTGYSSITLATDNDYLRMLGEVGILGSGAFLLFMISIIMVLIPQAFTAYKGGLEDIFASSITAAIPGVLLNMVFIDILEASKFAILFWLILGICFGTYQRRVWEK